MIYPNRIPSPLTDFTVVNNRLYIPSAIGTPLAVQMEQFSVVDLNGGGDIPATSDLIQIRSGSPTLTLFNPALKPFKPFYIKNSGTGTVTINPFAAETIDGETSANLLQYDSLCLCSDGTNWMVL